ncbi:MarR family winged helix-turn-helix transcriptional regulator [Micromonospora sp. NPDC049175]|uniref:MarR family winged helix-turn-helix transcriptional regulator n=1 Tax=Micromonospora sp. NPDC049175 TaxID=3364266 RepID=UPI0037191D31
MPADERLGFDIKRAEQALMAAKAAALRPAELTVAQYAALFALADNPGMSGAALARACLVTPQAMTGVLKALEDRGLVRRSPHPWHRHVLETSLTEKGRATLLRCDREAVRIERRIADALSPAERHQLRDLLARCVEAIHDSGQPEAGRRVGG